MKKYFLVLVLMLMMAVLAACGSKDNNSVKANSKEEIKEEQQFDAALGLWTVKFKEMLDSYSIDYKIDAKYQENDETKANAVNSLRAEWDSFNTELKWNPKMNDQKAILDSVDDLTFSMEKLLEYKSNFFRTGDSHDYDMLAVYEKEYNNQLSYFQTLIDKYSK